MTDAEWAVFAPFLIESGRRGGRPAQDHRKVMDAILWVTRTGSPWRDLPTELGRWNSVFRQYRRWTEAGIWDLMVAALAESEASDNVTQMIDSTIIRAHHHAGGGKGGWRETVSAVRAVASRPRSTPGRMPKGLASASA
jgi:transposase